MWSSDEWDEHFEMYGVLVMTPAVFLNSLDHGFISLERVNLLVFDECHRATGDDPYVGIMKLYKELPKNTQPRVLGLTASVVNSQVCYRSRVKYSVVIHLFKGFFFFNHFVNINLFCMHPFCISIDLFSDIFFS